MKRLLILSTLLILLLALVGAAYSSAYAAVIGYNLPWWTVDSGSGLTIGAGYQLSGTIGQSEAGPDLRGAGYQLAGGFWGGVQSPLGIKIFLPLTLKH